MLASIKTALSTGGSMDKKDATMPQEDDSTNTTRTIGEELSLGDENNKAAKTTSGDETDRAYEPSVMEMVLFSSGIAGYRVIRLTIELFLVLRLEELDMKVSQAGLLYLLYSLASVFTGALLFKYPSVFFRGRLGAISFPLLSVMLMTGGFFGIFLSKTFVIMVVSALVCGIGCAAWSIYYQALTSMTFSQDKLGDVARMRQGYECLGFLLPSICLAIINSYATDGHSTVQLSVLVLGVVAALFHLLSFRVIFSSGVRLACCSSPDSQSPEKETTGDSVWAFLNLFFGTSIILYFLLTAVLLAASCVLMGTMSLITQVIFEIEPTFLWIAAIGFPIGGILNVGAGTMGWKRDPRTTVLEGSACLAVMFSLIIVAYSIVSIDNDTVAKTFLFLFGLAFGILYSGTYIAALELWFLKLKDYPAAFVSRACAIDDLGNQAFIACTFQLQMILVEHTIGKEDNLRENPQFVEALVFFGPLAGMFIIAFILGKILPCKAKVVIVDMEGIDLEEAVVVDTMDVSDEYSC